MTEDIDPTPRHGHSRDREPSSASIDIARLKERHNALKEDVNECGVTIIEVKSLLLAHIANAGDRHAQLLATFNQHNLEDSVVHQKVKQIDRHLEATDTRLENMNKRDPVSFWTSIAAAGTAIGAIATAVWGGRP